MVEIKLKKDTIPIVRKQKADILSDLDEIKSDVLESFADSIALTTKNLTKDLDLSDEFNYKNLKQANNEIPWNEYKRQINNDIFSYCDIVIDDTLEYEEYEDYHDTVKNKVKDWLRRNARSESIDITDKSEIAFRKNYQEFFSNSTEDVPSPLIIKNSIGLPPKHTKAVSNYILRLREDLSFKKARQRGMDYITNLRKRRGELIAQTELWETIMKTRVMLHDHLFMVGKLDKRKIGKQWISREGGCKTCQNLDGEVRQWSETFDGKIKFPVAHTSCTCGYRLVKL